MEFKNKKCIFTDNCRDYLSSAYGCNIGGGHCGKIYYAVKKKVEFNLLFEPIKAIV